MTPRSMRRALERKARKETERKARKEMERRAKAAPAQCETDATPETIVPAVPEQTPAPHSTFSPGQVRLRRRVATEALCWDREPSREDSPTEHKLFTSAAQFTANRANAQLSSGPTTPEGKTTSSLNAVKTALTGRTVLLPSDDAPTYQLHIAAYNEDLQPVGTRESDLVQSIADTTWRLKRIPCLETAIFAQGHIEFAEAFNDHDASLRASMIELQTFLKYEKQLRNLQLQESRLARRREKEMIELRQLQQERREPLQQERKEKEREALETASRLYLAAREANQPFEPPANGFVFSTAQLEEHLDHLPARYSPRLRPSVSPNEAPRAPKSTQQAA